MEEADYTVNQISLARVRNLYELVVIRMMQKLIPEFPEFDNCPICIEDVYALSLSRIPATYIRCDSVLDCKDTEEENIREIVRYAIFHVMSQPKHPK